MDMQNLSQRAEKLIDAISNAFMSTAEAAAERIELASEVARIRQRGAAFSAVLEVIAAQKQAVLELADQAPSKAARASYQAQLASFTAQEARILERMGVPQEVAAAAIDETDRLYVRDGRRFVAANGSN